MAMAAKIQDDEILFAPAADEALTFAELLGEKIGGVENPPVP
jgi:hypothetical protein